MTPRSRRRLAELFDGLAGVAEDQPLLAGVQRGDDRGGVVQGADVVEFDVARRRYRSRRRGGRQVGSDDASGPSVPRPSPAARSAALRVADGRRQPDPLQRRPIRRVSRSRTASRCQPRSSPAKACTSSTTTARRPAKNAPVVDVRLTSIASSDSGVVSRTSGRVSRGCARRRDGGDVAVPERGPPARASRRSVASRGCRLLSSALSGQT